MFTAVYAAALALLAEPSDEEAERQLTALDAIIDEASAPAPGSG